MNTDLVGVNNVLVYQNATIKTTYKPSVNWAMAPEGWSP